ncbi:carboxypeptidase-like regulatory domain-containing protein [Thiolapillus sp.]|uniref:carboxypeptidase-like regulatory domain-containing protein n=3 Tax=Thiolapillus sp. TaxID=2017437 RepID=UPI003AF89D4C
MAFGSSFSWSTKKYAKEYYSDAGDIDGATNISVTAGATTPNINAVLALAPPSIQGTVTEDGTGAPVPQCTVSASNAGTWIQSLTDVNGHYVISGLPDGDYRVFFQCGETYRNEFHNDAIDYDSATLVSVSSTTAPIIIDAGVSRFTSFVTGTVTDEITGILLGGRYVSSHFQGAGWLNDYTWTDVCGLFDVSYGFQYGTRRAGNHVDHSYKSSVVSIASGSCSGCLEQAVQPFHSCVGIG